MDNLVVYVLTEFDVKIPSGKTLIACLPRQSFPMWMLWVGLEKAANYREVDQLSTGTSNPHLDNGATTPQHTACSQRYSGILYTPCSIRKQWTFHVQDSSRSEFRTPEGFKKPKNQHGPAHSA